MRQAACIFALSRQDPGRATGPYVPWSPSSSVKWTPPPWRAAGGDWGVYVCQFGPFYYPQGDTASGRQVTREASAPAVHVLGASNLEATPSAPGFHSLGFSTCDSKGKIHFPSPRRPQMFLNLCRIIKEWPCDAF